MTCVPALFLSAEAPPPLPMTVVQLQRRHIAPPCKHDRVPELLQSTCLKKKNRLWASLNKILTWLLALVLINKIIAPSRYTALCQFFRKSREQCLYNGQILVKKQANSRHCLQRTESMRSPRSIYKNSVFYGWLLFVVMFHFCHQTYQVSSSVALCIIPTCPTLWELTNLVKKI